MALRGASSRWPTARWSSTRVRSIRLCSASNKRAGSRVSGAPATTTVARDSIPSLGRGGSSWRPSPSFAAAAVVTLALGIGANLAIYQVLNAVVFRDLPVRDPARLVEIQLLESNEPTRVSYPLFHELSGRQQVLDGMFAVSDFS